MPQEPIMAISNRRMAGKINSIVLQKQGTRTKKGAVNPILNIHLKTHAIPTTGGNYMYNQKKL